MIFKITRNPGHGAQPCITGSNLPLQTMKTISRIISNQFTDSTDYKLNSRAHGFLQGYEPRNEEGGGWILVEFWTKNMEAIQALVDYINSEINNDKLRRLLTE